MKTISREFAMNIAEGLINYIRGKDYSDDLALIAEEGNDKICVKYIEDTELSQYMVLLTFSDGNDKAFSDHRITHEEYLASFSNVKSVKELKKEDGFWLIHTMQMVSDMSNSYDRSIEIEEIEHGRQLMGEIPMNGFTVKAMLTWKNEQLLCILIMTDLGKRK